MKRKYFVTIQRTGFVCVEAEDEGEAMDIADHQTTDTVTWSDDWSPTDVMDITGDDMYANESFVSEYAF